MEETNTSLPDAFSYQWLERVRRSKAALFLDVNSYSKSLAHFDRATAYLEGEANRRNGALVVIGMHGSGLAHGLSSQLWSDWNLPAQLDVSLAEAEKVEEHLRAWLSEMASSYPGGVEVLACQRTLRRWAFAQNSSTPGAVLANASARLIPRVRLVPAMVTASAYAQHAGSAYVVSTT